MTRRRVYVLRWRLTPFRTQLVEGRRPGVRMPAQTRPLDARTSTSSADAAVGTTALHTCGLTVVPRNVTSKRTSNWPGVSFCRILNML